MQETVGSDSEGTDRHIPMYIRMPVDGYTHI